MKKGIFRRAGIATLATALAAVSFGVLPFAAPASAQTEDVACERIFGEDRYGTAAALALETFADTTVDTVFIARGDGTPNNPLGVPFDALAGSYGAGQFNGPILLVEGQNPEIKQATVDAIETLDPTNAFVLGGPAAVSDEVLAEIDALVENVERVGGDDRFHTAAIIAGAAGAPGADGTTFENAAGESAVFLAAGSDARQGADALAAGGPAYAAHIPILLTESENLNAHAAGFIDSGVERVYILGGEVAISTQVEEQVAALNNNGTAVTRIFGEDRAATAVDLAIDFLIDELGWSTDHFNLANGQVPRLVDAIASGPHAGNEEGMVLLTEGSDTLGNDTEAFLEDLNDGELASGETVDEPETAHIIGGPVAINEETAQEACTLAGVPVDQAPGGDAAALTLTPESETNPVGADHTVTADLDNADGGPAANGQTVRFEVYDAATGDFVTGGFDTSTGGTADFTLEAGTVGANADVVGDDDGDMYDIVACVVANQTTGCTDDGTLERDPLSGEPSNVTAEVFDIAEKAYENRVASALVLTPESDMNPSGEDHTVTATVTDQFGDELEGQAVRFELFVDTDYDGSFAFVESEDTTTGGDPIGPNEGQAEYTFSNTAVIGLFRVVACVPEAGVCTSAPDQSTPGDNSRAIVITADIADTADKEYIGLADANAQNGNTSGEIVFEDDLDTIEVFTDGGRYLEYTYATTETFIVDGVETSVDCFRDAADAGDDITVAGYSVSTDNATYSVTDANNSGANCENL